MAAPPVGSNYLEGANPFRLATPSPWWLQLLYDYDPYLVVIPGIRHPVYRLCRRTALARQLGRQASIVHTHPDTVQMIQHALVPITTLVPWAIRSDKVIRDLMARDRTRLDPGETADDRLQAHDQAAEARQRQGQQDRFDAIGGDAFRSLQYRLGARTSLATPRVASRPPLPLHSPASSSGIVLTD